MDRDWSWSLAGFMGAFVSAGIGTMIEMERSFEFGLIGLGVWLIATVVLRYALFRSSSD